MRLLFDRSLLTDDQQQLLALVVHEKNGVAQLKELMAFETDDDALLGAVTMITQEWKAAVRPTETRIDLVAPAKPEKRKTRAPQTPSGVCAHCGREAVLVKALGICRPCHMNRLKAHPRAEKMAAAIAKNTARIDANIERVVAKAKEQGTIGAHMEKTMMGFAVNSGNGIHARKVG